MIGFVEKEQKDYENLRIRMSPSTKATFDALIKRKKISQQDAIVSLVTMLMAQDDVVQSVLLGQILPHPDVVELAIRRLAESAAHGKGAKRLKPYVGVEKNREVSE